MRRISLAAAGALALTLAACSGDLPTPTGNEHAVVRYDVRLASPNALDAGALVRFSGTVDSITVADGIRSTFMERVKENGVWKTRVVLTGAIHAGSLATVWGLRANAAPTVQLEQVAAPAPYAQRALTGYSITLVRAEGGTTPGSF